MLLVHYSFMYMFHHLVDYLFCVSSSCYFTSHCVYASMSLCIYCSQCTQLSFFFFFLNNPPPPKFSPLPPPDPLPIPPATTSAPALLPRPTTARTPRPRAQAELTDAATRRFERPPLQSGVLHEQYRVARGSRPAY